jgi:hypothetical protein
MVPSFASDTHDYYVPCAASNQLTVSMTAAAGSSGLLISPESARALPQQTVSVGVKEDEAIVAAATDGTRTTEYWIRCLPPDFPPLDWSPHADATSRPPGYYLVGNLALGLPEGVAGYAMILDGNGVPVWYARAPTGFAVSTVESLSPGSIAYFPYQIPGLASFRIVDLGSETVTAVVPEDEVVANHELRQLPNGDYLAFTIPTTSGVDLTGLPVVMPDGTTQTFGPNSTINDCGIVEFSSDRRVVWTWLASDHFEAREDSTLATASTVSGGGTEVDVFHCNSIDIDPTSGNLLISARNMSSVFYVDRSTGAVLWKMGGTTFSKDNATYVSVADPFVLQHDARLQPSWSSVCGGSGQISVFDDESLGTAPARGVIYDVIVGASDMGTAACQTTVKATGHPPGTATRIWEYKGTFSAGAMGSFRISADGSRIIGWGISENTTFTEVNIEGDDLLDFTFGGGNPSYRAIKLPLSAFDLSVLRRTAGLQ